MTRDIGLSKRTENSGPGGPLSNKEASHHSRVILEFRGSQIKAAGFLNMKATTLNQKIKRCGLRSHTYASIDCGSDEGRPTDNSDGSVCSRYKHGQSKLFVVQ